MLKKDIIELCLLHLIAEKELYGYELLRRLHMVLPDVQESALYATLRKLCGDNLILACRSQTVGGPPRKYYKITEDGREKLSVLLTDWHNLSAALRDIGIV